MARFLLCLCLVLTLSMDGSRWAAAIRTGSSGTGFWWGTKESQQPGAATARLRTAGNFAGAEVLYERQPVLARRTYDDVAEVRSLLSTGGVRALAHHYRSSPAPMLEARRRAKTIGDRLDMEAEAGLRFPPNQIENFHTQTSLVLLQQRLGNPDLLLSFHLTQEGSYVWALTRQSLNLYALAPAAQILKKIEEFRAHVWEGHTAAWSSGSGLYHELCGRLSLFQAAKPDWLLSLDDALFEAPLAALDWYGKYVVEMRSLKVLPGAMCINRKAATKTGDPIYNRADPRWRWTDSPLFRPWLAQAAPSDESLNRLVASGSEVESSAPSWSSSAMILRGANARLENFIALAGRGLEPSGGGGYLTTADVAGLNVPGAIVTMTGCETGGGEASAGAGLPGLTRAWQMAGASAVISILWPVRDSNGELFTGFYRCLRTMPPAEAPRQSQLEMIRSGTWRAAPRYWASYQLTGGQVRR